MFLSFPLHQGQHAEAEALYARSIEIGDNSVGPDHPDQASRLLARANILTMQVRV